MAKVTHRQIERLGFTPDQFGAPGDWLAPDGYLAEVMNDVAAFVQEQVGSAVYGAATGTHLVTITDAEKALVSAELWRRRASFLDAGASLSNSDTGFLMIREYLANAEGAEQRGLDLIALVSGASVRGGVSVGIVASGHLPRVTG